MDTFLEFINPFIPFIINGLLIVLVFVFVVKPLLNYFIVNREIEHRKKLAREYRKAKLEAEAARAEIKDDTDTEGREMNSTKGVVDRAYVDGAEH
jgi:hypothetical protein